MRWPKPKELTIAAFGVLAASLGATSCEENNTILFVAGLLKTDSTCVVSGDLAAGTLLGGSLDLGLRPNYWAAVLVGNQLIARGAGEQLRAESSRVTLRGAIIELTDTTGVPLHEPFSSPGVGFVHPGSTATPGSGAMTVEVIPPGYIDEDMLVIANIQAYGQTLGGAIVVSSILSFPIQVCTDGCLVDFPSEALDEDGDCVASDGGEPFDGCWEGQDGELDCRLCARELAVCRRPGG